MNSCTPGKGLTNGFDPRCLFQNGFSFGEADLVQGGSFREVVGRTLLALLSARRSNEGSLVFKHATVILPPIVATKLTESSLHIALKKSLQELRGGLAEESEIEELIRKIKVIYAPSLMVSDLVHLVDQQGTHTIPHTWSLRLFHYELFAAFPTQVAPWENPCHTSHEETELIRSCA